MPRPLWKGSISFGLVNIPVTLHGAVTPETLRFRQIDRRSKAPVKEKRVSERTGQEVPWDDVVKGYEYEDGRYVLLEDNELRQANVKATQTIDIVQFARREEIDPLYFETPYYVAPGKGGAKGYALLREALRGSNRVGIAKVVVRFRQHMAALMPEGRLLVLELLRYGHEMRDSADLEVPGDDLAEVGVSPREVAMAEMLVQSMEEPWHPEAFHDEYRDAVLQLIDEKVRGGGERAEVVPEAEAQEEGAEVIDIMALLKRSVEAAGGEGAGARGASGPSGGAQRAGRHRGAAEAPPGQAAGARRKRV
jgi:DNA end-binding protein Ku